MPPSAKAPTPQDDHAWEKEFAPKITKRHLWTVIVIYMVWLLMLAGLSYERWFVSLR